MVSMTIFRRRFFVQRRFQGRFIAIFCALALLAAVVAAAATGIAVDAVLKEAMFRAHISERSTGEIVLPVLLNVNVLVSAVATLVSVLVAAVVFRRSAAHLGHLCERLAEWEARLGELRDGGSDPPCLDEQCGWALDLGRAVLLADASLRARYRPLAERAARTAGTARRCETALAQEGGTATAGGELDLISREIEALDQELSRFQG